MASTIVQLPFTGGPLQRTAREYVNPSSNLLDVQNGVYTYDGAVDKRLGVAPLSNAQIPNDPAMATPLKLLSRGSEVLATDGDALFSYAPDNAGVWVGRGYLPHCTARRTSIAALPVNATGEQIAEGFGYRAFVFRTFATGGPTAGQGDVFFSLYSLTSGGPIIEGFQITTGATFLCPMVLIVGSHAYVFYTDGASGSGNVWGTVLNLTTFVWTAPVVIVGDDVAQVSGVGCIDVVATTGGILLIYSQYNGAVSSPRYLRLEALPALTVTASAVIVASTGTDQVDYVACAFDATLNVVWFFWERQPSIGGFILKARAMDAGFAGYLSAAFTVTTNGYTGADTASPISVCPLTSTTAVFVGSPADSGPSTVVYTSTGTRFGDAIAPLGSFASRPFRMTVGGQMRCYILFLLSQAALATNGAEVFNTYYLLDTQAQFLSLGGTNGGAIGPASATVAPRQSNAVTVAKMPTDGRLFAPVIGNGYARMPVTTNGTEELTNQDTTTLATMTVGVATFDFSFTAACQYAEGNNESFYSLGMPSYYDGGDDQELGFPHWPICTSLTTTAASGGLTNAAYGYAFCFAQADNQGLLHRSAFWSQSITPPHVANTVTAVVSALYYSWRSGSSTSDNTAPPVVEVYRTVANGTILYYVGSVAPGGTFVDANADATISSNTLQYTTGGVMDSVIPPSAPAGMIRHVDRLWMIDDTGQNIWYTTTFNAGDAPYFNETLTLTFTRETLTALASMDDKLVAFSAASIWYVEGYGPPNTGLGSDLTTAVAVPTDTGAADWRSIVTVPSVGIFFQSPLNGLIYLLDRSLNVSCVGKVVQDWFATVANGTFLPVVSANLVPLTTQIRFVLGESVVFYDYVQMGPSGVPGRWSRASYPSAGKCAMTPLGGPWTVAGYDGRIYQEKAPSNPTKNYDTLTSGASQWVTTTITLADFKPGGGLQSAAQLDFVQCLARPLDPCDVMATLAYDYGSYQESRSFTWAQLSAGIQASPALAMWRVSPFGAYSQPMSVNLTLSDAPPTGGGATIGAGMRWLGTAWSVSQIGAIYDKLSQVVRK